ncbi:MAG: hypothetical protein EOM11_10375 [Erysipelotrichia bacterium]|nr:hypothetical protein [Erysipelotrichia bacterium]
MFKVKFKTTLVLTIVSIAILNLGCASTSSTAMLKLLEPSNDKISTKLLPLEITTAEQLALTGTQYKDVTRQSHLLTIFERELKNNVIQSGKEKYGYIEMKLTYQTEKYSPAGIPFVILSFSSLFMLNVIGMPWSINDLIVQSEINIFDENKVEVKKYIYTRSKRYVLGLYYNGLVATTDEHLLKIYRDVINDLKNDLEKDAIEINNSLKSAKANES